MPYAVVNGRYESEIPWQLQDEANRNGLRIIASDYRRNVYVIELLPNATLTRGAQVVDEGDAGLPSR